MSIITLTTDFGLRDWFVGTLKGVLLGIAENANVVDITHEIPPADIRAAAFALRAAYEFFPSGTVHVAVVDPGVGGRRAAIAIRTAKYMFVAPDNGVLSLVLEQDPALEIRRLENSSYFLPLVSRTFHGRDVFAPVAAHLSRGVPMADLGPELREIVRLEVPAPRFGPGRLYGAVVYIDRFGNAITNLPHKAVEALAGTAREIRVAVNNSGLPLCDSYNSVESGQALGILGSSGYLEIAVNQGHAANALGLKIDSPIIVETLYKT
jgi:S-adenosylmethionine hydrolase